jgi:hypothetical protein
MSPCLSAPQHFSDVGSNSDHEKDAVRINHRGVEEKNSHCLLYLSQEHWYVHQLPGKVVQSETVTRFLTCAVSFGSPCASAEAWDMPVLQTTLRDERKCMSQEMVVL